MSDNDFIPAAPAPGDTQPLKRAARPARWRSVLFSVLGVGALLALAIFGGYSSGVAQRKAARSEIISQQLLEQFQLALVDKQFGRYEAARQRLRYIIKNDPGFPGAQQELANVLVQLAIDTPTATPKPTPTPDMRGVQALFATTQQLVAAGDWSNALEALGQLRKQDPNYSAAQVDGMFYFCLRNYGVTLIQQGDLEGGIYQLGLAERFAPLDQTANNVREGARLYIQAASYFGIKWSSAVELFRTVAGGWPAMWDGSMNANQRLRIALMRYADELWAGEDGCAASGVYNEAKVFGELDQTAGRNANQAFQQCYPATEEPTLEPTAEVTEEPPTEEPPTEPPPP